MVPLNNVATVESGKMKLKDIGIGDAFLNGFVAWGDVANLTRAVLDTASFIGARKLIDARMNLPAELHTGIADGFHDMRHAGIKIPFNDGIQAQWTEDASTNVEPALLLLISWGAMLPMEKAQIVAFDENISSFTLGVLQASTTAAAYSTSANDFDANTDSVALTEAHEYAVVAMSHNGFASGKVIQIVEGGLQGGVRPGVPGLVDPQESKVPFDPFNYSPVVIDGSSLIESFDVAGSTTPTALMDIRRIA